MSMPLPEGYVLPKPGIPKTLGILSIIFATLALLQGLCGVVSTAFSAQMMDAMGGAVKNAQAPLQQRTQGQIDALETKEKAATTDAEKASLKQQRESLQAQKDMTGNSGMDIAKDILKDPTIKIVTYLNLIVTFVLGALLLYAGIGLVKLQEWGRKSGAMWGGIALGWVVIYMVLQFGVVMPATKPFQDKQMAQMQEQMKKVNNPNMPDMAQLTKVTQAATAVGVVVGLVLTAIFPTVMLILLNGKGARAACQASKKLDNLQMY